MVALFGSGHSGVTFKVNTSRQMGLQHGTGSVGTWPQDVERSPVARNGGRIRAVHIHAVPRRWWSDKGSRVSTANTAHGGRRDEWDSVVEGFGGPWSSDPDGRVRRMEMLPTGRITPVPVQLFGCRQRVICAQHWRNSLVQCTPSPISDGPPHECLDSRASPVGRDPTP